MTPFEIVKKLEYLVAFQSGCLQNGDWEAFDRSEDSIKKIETHILQHFID